MQIKRTNSSDTKIKLSINAAKEHLDPIKENTLKRLSANVKVAGFREGSAPLNLVEKNLDQQLLQSEFVQEAINHLYGQALEKENIRPIKEPEVSLKKFVPFSELEFDVDVEVMGNIKLANYKNFKKKPEPVKVTDKDINDVLDNLKKREAERKEVKREAKNGDEVLIDFKGVDSKKQPISGADGKDYPLVLGSDTFIPGFEKNLIGVKSGQEKSFDITFPKDYGVAALAGKKASFTVNVKKVSEVTDPKIDDAFAKKLGPFKSVAELKADIKAQLEKEKQAKARQDFEVSLIEELADKSKFSVPESLIDEQLQRDRQTIAQNLMYRGQTFPDFVKNEGKTEEEYIKEVLKPQAEKRVKASIALAEVADAEKLSVSQEEVDLRMQMLKAQYQDPSMQAELDKPETRRDIAARMLTEKTVEKLVNYATK